MQQKLGPIGSEVKKRLIEAFSPTLLDVIDESEQHVGHAGYRDCGETHFRVVIDSKSVDAHTRIQKHQQVYKVIGDLLESHIHALSIDFK